MINTPYGHYSTDWAIVYKDSDKTAKLYFIVETKIDKELSGLNDIEQAKIKCGELHFKAMAEDVRFKCAKNYRYFLEQVGHKASCEDENRDQSIIAF